MLNAEEVEGTKERIASLQALIESADKDSLHAGIEALNDFTRPFAERVMDKAVQQAMKGKVI
jgi:molecular chaperone HscA